MLRAAGGDSVAVSNELGRFSPLKQKAEYVSDEMAAPVTKQGVGHAHHWVVISRRMDPRSCTAACPGSAGQGRVTTAPNFALSRVVATHRTPRMCARPIAGDPG
jgi:hypothetical protein